MENTIQINDKNAKRGHIFLHYFVYIYIVIMINNNKNKEKKKKSQKCIRDKRNKRVKTYERKKQKEI